MYPRFLIALSTVALLTANCNKTSFRGREKSQPATQMVNKEARFALNERGTRELDMVWVIDNSASMQQEVNNVRTNISAFASSLQGVTNLKLAVISAKETNTQAGQYGMDVAGILPGATQISVNVASTNGLAILANASCPGTPSNMMNNAETIYNGNVPICGTDVGSVERPVDVNSTAGQLAAFYREGSKKVFVFVTDDNAGAVDANNFWSHILKNSAIKQQDASVYGFIGLSKNRSTSASCQITREGLAYASLAQTSGGVFDICLADWKPHFDALKANIIQTTKTNFVIQESAALEVVDVVVDNAGLAKSEYQVNKNAIKLLHPEKFTAARELVVTYRLK